MTRLKLNLVADTIKLIGRHTLFAYRSEKFTIFPEIGSVFAINRLSYEMNARPQHMPYAQIVCTQCMNANTYRSQTIWQWFYCCVEYHNEVQHSTAQRSTEEERQEHFDEA